MSRLISAVGALLLLFSTQYAAADQYSFVTLRLPHGIQIDAPRTWHVLDEAQNNLIATARDAALDLSGTGVRYTGNVLFAANSTPATTYASMRVSLDPSMAATPADLTEMDALSNADLGAMEPGFRDLMSQTLAPQGLLVLDSLGLFKESYGAYPAISYRYRRSGPNGSVIVDLIQIFRSDAAIRINLAYKESEELIWRVVIQRIKQSILVN